MASASSGEIALVEVREKLWKYLKPKAEADLDPLGGDNFNAITVSGNENRPGPDALWALAIAGILRHQVNHHYSLTEQGWRILSEDVSPYEGDPFVLGVERRAPTLDEAAKGYLELSVRCL